MQIEANSQIKNRITQHGFTVVELLIVIVVIGILAAITIVTYNGIQNKARIATVQSDLNGAAKTLEIANVSGSAYPTTLSTANLKASGGTSFAYRPDASLSTYCLTAINGGISYHVTNASSTPTTGDCSGVMAGGGSCPTGYLVVPGSLDYGTSEFCVMKYPASNSSGLAVSASGVQPWVSINQTSAITAASSACAGCHLITEAEWLTIAQNVLGVASNWSGGSVGSGFIYSGHNDNVPTNALVSSSDDNDGYSGTGNSAPSNQRRTLTLSNGNVIWDLAGNVWQWTDGTSTTGQPGSSGYAWRQWNALSTPGTLSPSPMPLSSYGGVSSSTWTSAQGIGQVYSDSGIAVLRGFIRGGFWNRGSYDGVLALDLSGTPNALFNSIGFRVTR